jgi:hypothetical protein
MKPSDIELEVLRKFNSGKNAATFDNELQPGTYPVQMTVTIEGNLHKGNPGTTKRRDTSGSAHIVRYLLDRINEATYNCLIREIDNIRKGEFTVKNGKSRYETPRAGSTRVQGQVVVEDIVDTPTYEDLTPGLKLVEGG